jgi:uncharacterized membrane-anchored protein YitT (DUF2179 family)
VLPFQITPFFYFTLSILSQQFLKTSEKILENSTFHYFTIDFVLDKSYLSLNQLFLEVFIIAENKLKLWYKKAFYFIKKEYNTFFLSTLGSVIFTIGVTGFTIPYHFPDSGLMGIALIFKYTVGLPPSIVHIVLNSLLLLWARKELPKRFVGWTIYNVLLISTLLQLLGSINFPPINDMLLVAVAAGLIKGIGLGITFFSGASSGGLDIIASVLRKRLGAAVGKYTFFMNVFILSASVGTVGFEKVLYGFVATYISGQTIDRVLSSFDRRKLVFIVSEHENRHHIVDFISSELSRGSTLFDTKGGYSHAESSTMMCLLTRRQTMELKCFLAENFPRTFLVISDASEVLGKGFKRWKNI